MARRRPFGITLLAIVQIVSGLQSLLGMVWLFAVSANADTAGVQDALIANPWVAENAETIFFWLGVVYMVLGLAALALAYGYLKGREWARRRGRSISILAILLAFLTMILAANPAPVGTMIFNLVIFVYLGRPKIKAFFRSGD
ncbi:MAG: hypothetical protein A3K75_02220 [Euryarchaeota archaeon RBG_13_61_15]|nr:MAG: hypothetical protein A3K75_02220 [Euryarchaeota archaeon RBG_13_61_15]